MNAITRAQLANLLATSQLKPRMVRELRFVPEEVSDWEDRDFLAVTNRSFSEGVLVAPLEKTYVVPFRLQKRSPNKTGRIEAIICDLCATWQRGSHSAIISFVRADGSSISLLCCADLACSLHVRSKTSQSKLSRTQLREDITPARRVARLRDKLHAIFTESL